MAPADGGLPGPTDEAASRQGLRRDSVLTGESGLHYVFTLLAMNTAVCVGEGGRLGVGHYRCPCLELSLHENLLEKNRWHRVTSRMEARGEFNSDWGKDTKALLTG